jgi:hypothetical protein
VGVAEGEPFYHLCEFGWQSVRMSPVTPLATGQPGEAIASIPGPALRGPQRNAMITGHVGQRHVVFHTGPEHPISFQCSRPLFGRPCCQRRDVLGLLMHRKLFMILYRYQNIAGKIFFSAKRCKRVNTISRD